MVPSAPRRLGVFAREAGLRCAPRPLVADTTLCDSVAEVYAIRCEVEFGARSLEPERERLESLIGG